MSNDITYEMLKALPKTDLHIHLDGSLRLGTIINLADSSNVNLYNELNETATLGTEKLTNNSFTSDLK